MSSGTRGIAYFACGKQFLEEANISAASARSCMPHLPVTLFTDQPSERSDLYDEVVRLETDSPFREKLRCLAQSPYDRTLFLDTDTYLLADVTEILDLLDTFDLAATHDRGYEDWFPSEAGVPEPFREFNTGVIAFRKSGTTDRFLESCLTWYDRLSQLPRPAPRIRGYFPDQPAFRAAAYHSGIRIATLTMEYNCRFPYFGAVSGSVKILHGREFLTEFGLKDLNAAGDRLNALSIPRVYVAGEVLGLAKASQPWKRRYFPQYAGNSLPATWRWLAGRARRRLGR